MEKPAAEGACRAAAGHDANELPATQSASAGRLRDVPRQAGGCAGPRQVRRRRWPDRTVEHAAPRRVPRFRPTDRGCGHGSASLGPTTAGATPSGAADTAGRAPTGTATVPIARIEV